MLYLQEKQLYKKNPLWSHPTIAILHIRYYSYLKVVCEYIQSTHRLCPWLFTWLDCRCYEVTKVLTSMRARLSSQSVACRLSHGLCTKDFSYSCYNRHK